MKKLAVFLALLLMLGTVPAAMAESTGLGVVTTAFGDVSGVYENGVTYYKGVPYAAPPVGGLRWAAPVDPEPWDGVLACDEYAPMAMQILSTTDWWGEEFYYDWLDEYPPMSEDCLYLNVVTPAASSDDSYPVFVWFHGGAGMHGYSWEPEFEPSELAKKGVIVVSVGYRLGLFGYMALEELSEASPTGTSGNYGLLDQIKSLEWVQQNIAAFGGDPSRVTIGGQSAGASAVTAILTSPLSKGLVTGAIMNSSFGAFGSSVTSMEDMYANCNAYLDEKGYGEMTLEELRALPTSAFINETTEKPEIYGKGFGRCLDGWSVTETPIDFFLREGSLEGINLLYGSNSGEGNGSFTISTQEDIFASAKGTYGGLYDKYNFEGLYKGTDDIGATLESLRLRSERGGMQSIIIAEVLSQTQPGSNLYPYYFDHWTPGREEEIRWSWHSGELWYAFASLRDIPEQRDWEPLDYAVADMYSSYWANFIATGNPNGDGVPYWPSASLENPVLMYMGDEFYLRDGFYGGTKLADRDAFMREYIITRNNLEAYYG